jgi:hypothetical protein
MHSSQRASTLAVRNIVFDENARHSVIGKLAGGKRRRKEPAVVVKSFKVKLVNPWEFCLRINHAENLMDRGPIKAFLDTRLKYQRKCAGARCHRMCSVNGRLGDKKRDGYFVNRCPWVPRKL